MMLPGTYLKQQNSDVELKKKHNKQTNQQQQQKQTNQGYLNNNLM